MNKKNIALALACGFCSYMAVAAISKGSGVKSEAAAVAVVMIALVWAILAGLFLAHIITPKIGAFFGNFIYMPLEYLKKAPEKIAPVKGLIEQEKYPEAIAALNEILERKAFEPSPYLLLVEVYMDKLNDKNQTAELIEKYFRNPKLKAVPENVEMLMRYSDICLEQNNQEPAIALFELQLKAKGYSVPERRGLSSRLEALIAKKSCL